MDRQKIGRHGKVVENDVMDGQKIGRIGKSWSAT